MTETRLSPAPGAAPPVRRTSALGTAGNLLRSEWTKLRSVRSTVWTLLITVVIMIGAAALAASATSGGDGNGMPTADRVLLGASFAQLAIVALGVLTISAEYRTGMIRTTFTAAPRRAGVLAAKAAVFAGTVLVTGLVAAFGAFFIGQAILGGKGLELSLGQPEAVRAVVGAALYLTVTGLIGLGLGTLIRHTAGAITTAVALLFILPPLVAALPGEWGQTFSRYFLSNAGSRVMVTRVNEDLLGPWAGFGVYCLWCAVIAAAGLVLLRRRDV
ncbi:ABC transporter permease [Sphaerisporangium rufum]|uniref:ABC transporter permease n=1 Tax=Sphaerisporangium rufum TaxID=1381558 RepID=A0A919R1F4_9ACTN|nr:ABC transporter permease [Sphaerisporangium rufum]GII77912.1 ABC transporter permease [Sphaerisporangium rufum]